MACQISSIVKQRGLLLWMTGLTIVYQVFYQMFMLRVLSEHESAEEEECSSDLAATPRCMELRLFRDWHRSAPLLHDLSVRAVEDLEDEDDWPLDASPLAAATVATTPAPPAATTGQPALTDAEDSTRPTSLPFASPEASAAAPWSPMSAWARGLVDLQQRMEQRLESLPSMRHKRQEELSAALDRHAEAITRSLAKPGNFTRWGQDLEALQQKMETRMADRARHHHANHSNTSTNASAASAHGKEPSALMRHINSLLVEMCEEPHRRHREDCVKILSEVSPSTEERALKHNKELDALRDQQHQLEADIKAVADESVAWQKAFASRVDEAHKELCESPQRKHRADCIKFLADIAVAEREKTAALTAARKVFRAALRSNITKEAKERAQALDMQLATLSVHRQIWEQELLRKYNVASAQDKVQIEKPAPPVTVASSGSEKAHEMHWSAVRDWSKSRRLRGSTRGRVTFHRRDLRAGHWAGMIPKVACITTIKSSLAAKIQMKYFVDNFKNQTYEGPSQLVIVYHYKDREAADLAKMYADGFLIKAVASQNDAAAFPSTLDLRYGAWSASDADAIAQWNFDDWHHPHQLSSQVRALALASRPASMLVRHGARGARGAAVKPAAAEPELDEESVLGEAKWMHEHWHPLLKEEHSFIESARSLDVVQVDLATAVPHGGAGAGLSKLRSSLDAQFDRLAAALGSPAAQVPPSEPALTV